MSILTSVGIIHAQDQIDVLTFEYTQDINYFIKIGFAYKK